MIRAIGRPQSDKSVTFLSPYLLIVTDTPAYPYMPSFIKRLIYAIEEVLQSSLLVI